MSMRAMVCWMVVTVAIAQGGVPTPVGVWDFDSGDPNAATVGQPLTLVGVVQTVDGVRPGDGAVQIDVGSHFICRHGIAPNGGGTMVNQWTLLVDFQYPSSSVGKFVDIFQTDPANADDSDWTVHANDGAIGIAAVGYSRETGFTTVPEQWYRMVMPVDNGVRHDLFVDGRQVLQGRPQGLDGRFALADVLLLFAANDGDDNAIQVSKVAIWDRALTAGEAVALGDPNTPLEQANKAPDVDAGADQETELDASGSIEVVLDATVDDDGAYAVSWELVSGPASVTFDDPSAEDTTVTMTVPGTYELRLTADDGQFAMSDTVVVVVHPANYGGLIVHWDFEEVWNGSTVQDVSGHGNDGQVVDGAVGQMTYIADGVEGQALDLQNGDYAADGDYVSLDLVMPDSGTIALWYKPHQFYNYNSVFDNSVEANDWEMWIYGNTVVRFRVQSGTEVSASLTTLAGAEDPLERWWHITVTWDRLDATTVRTQMYVDGILSQERVGPWVDPGRSFYLGGGHPGNDFGYGAVDDFRLYNRALAADEVLELVYGENVPPEVEAGPDQEFEMDEAGTPIEVTLDGTVTDVGTISVAWSKIAGPNDITFADPMVEDTTATISAPGRYVLQLAADDGEYIGTDSLTVWVHPHGYNGQLVHWDFETAAGNRVVDVSGHGADGRIVDGPAGSTVYMPGKLGQGLDLANGDYATGGDHVALEMPLPEAGTIALWYQPHAMYNYNSVFDNSVQQDDWEMWIYGDGRLRFRVDDTAFVTANLPALEPENPDPTGKWWHIAATWERRDEMSVAVKLYVNGALIDEAVGPWTDPGRVFYLGGGNPGNDYGWGLVDEFYLYDRPLDIVEILGLMYQGNKPPIVDAGPDQVKWLSDGQLTVDLAGSVIDDGGPGELVISWTKISGPNDITIEDSTQPATSATIYAPGIYQLQIDANDGQFYVADVATIEVYPEGYTGLIVHWPFDDDTLTDASGHGNDGVFVDGPAAEAGYVPGKLGRAWRPGNGDFATDGDYVSLGLTMPEAGTVAFWYYVNNLYNYVSLFDNSVQENDWEMWIYGDGRLRGRIQSGGEVTANLHALAPDGDARGDWFHIAFTWKRLSITEAEVALYVDGELIQSRVGPWVDPGATFYLGGGHDRNDYGDGIWDEVRLYERALTPTEVRLLASLSNFDDDFDVDLEDLRFLVERWLVDAGAECASTPAADYNMDCRTDVQDFAVFAQWWLEMMD